jgi:hypothetical protein
MSARIVALSAALLAGCFDNVQTPFPPGLEPLEAENEAPAPTPVDGDPYPEQLSWVRSFAPDTTERTPSVHARAYVHAPVAAVWEALRNPDVDADRRVFSSWSVVPREEIEYDYSYDLHAVIVNVITVEYDVTWHHGVVLGTLDEPELVAIRYQKTFGSNAIQDLRGSIVLREVTSDVTELQIIEYLRAVGATHANIESFLHDMYEEVLALSHGEPLPPVEEL